jgi:hypothetical protein
MQGEPRCRGRINGSEAVPEVTTVTHVHPPSTVTNGELLHMLAPQAQTGKISIAAIDTCKRAHVHVQCTLQAK